MRSRPLAAEIMCRDGLAGAYNAEPITQPAVLGRGGSCRSAPSHTIGFSKFWAKAVWAWSTRLMRFSGATVGNFRWSPDGSKLAVGRQRIDSDVVLLRDQAKSTD